MEQFYSLLCCWGRYSFDDPRMDIIASLPLEVACIILRLLDPKTLIAAMIVNRKWLRIIRSDCVLRKRVRTEVREQRRVKRALLASRARVRSSQADDKPRTLFAKKNEIKSNGVRTDQLLPQPLSIQNRGVSIHRERPLQIPVGARRSQLFSLKTVKKEVSRKPSPLKVMQSSLVKTRNLRL